MIQLCPECIVHDRAFAGEEDEVMGEEEQPVGLAPQEKKEWEKKLRLTHGATEHGSVESLINALKARSPQSCDLGSDP